MHGDGSRAPFLDGSRAFNTNDIQCGYSVSYFDGNTPYGYAILDFYNENIITDFAIEENALSLYDTILNNFGVKKYLKKNSNTIYKIIHYKYLENLVFKNSKRKI